MYGKLSLRKDCSVIDWSPDTVLQKPGLTSFLDFIRGIGLRGGEPAKSPGSFSEEEKLDPVGGPGRRRDRSTQAR